MTILCVMCHGSGWAYKYPTGLVKNKDIFILIPCKECKGTGFQEIKVDDLPKDDPKQ